MYRGTYTLIGNELSMFTRKLEAQLRFQNIPWQWQYKTKERAPDLEARAGTHFIPLLLTPDKWLIHDTIAIGPMLNGRFADRPVIPATPLQRACCYILEDAFNHWLSKPAIHSRWCYPENVAWVGLRFGANMVLDKPIDESLTDEELALVRGVGQMMYDGFGKNVCEVNGVGEDQCEAVQGDFQRFLEALATHFASNDYLLGPRPCLADFALAGTCKAHFITDPEPRSWLGEHLDMIEDYCARFFGQSAVVESDWMTGDRVPDTLQGVINYLTGSYYQYAGPNIRAGLAGEKYFEYDCGFGVTRARTQRRLNLARLHVQDELNAQGAVSDDAVKHLFKGTGILEYYLG